MSKHILKCSKCGNYTLSEKCACGGATVNPKPPKYSPEDKYGDYRRKSLLATLQSKGLL